MANSRRSTRIATLCSPLWSTWAGPFVCDRSVQTLRFALNAYAKELFHGARELLSAGDIHSRIWLTGRVAACPLKLLPASVKAIYMMPPRSRFARNLVLLAALEN